jgi:hypothetical protein
MKSVPSITIYITVGSYGDARNLNLTEAVERVTRLTEKEVVAIWQVSTNTARKVWQGTSEDARAGRGYVTEEPAPEIPPCKYPVGTVLTQLGKYRPGQTTIRGARLAWVYDYDAISGDAPMTGVAESNMDQHFTIAPPDPYPVGSEHVVDLGLLGRQTAKVVHRDGDVVTFVAMMHQDTATVAEFEKAVVK